MSSAGSSCPGPITSTDSFLLEAPHSLRSYILEVIVAVKPFPVKAIIDGSLPYPLFNSQVIVILVAITANNKNKIKPRHDNAQTVHVPCQDCTATRPRTPTALERPSSISARRWWSGTSEEGAC
jgi:hypothetical protein